jgi:transcriptional regulator with XRE-family HTH domain
MGARKNAKSFAMRSLDDKKVVIARNIRAVYQQNGWVLRELAEAAKCSIPTAHKLMKGDETNMSLDILTLMALELGFTMSFVMHNPNESL